jgi:hypothetical protein
MAGWYEIRQKLNKYFCCYSCAVLNEWITLLSKIQISQSVNVCCLSYFTLLEAKLEGAKPLFWRLFSGLSALKPFFSPGPANTEYAVDRVVLGQIFLRALFSDPVNII